MHKRFALDHNIVKVASPFLEVGIDAHHIQAINSLLQRLDLGFSIIVYEVVIIAVEAIDRRVDLNCISVLNLRTHGWPTTRDDLNSPGLRKKS